MFSVQHLALYLWFKVASTTYNTEPLIINYKINFHVDAGNGWVGAERKSYSSISPPPIVIQYCEPEFPLPGFKQLSESAQSIMK
jgi:hypothetical protein